MVTAIDKLSSQIEKLKRETEFQPVPKSGYTSLIIASGIPKVSKDNVSKLHSSLMKLFSKCGKVDFIHIPVCDSSNETLGYCLVDFEDEVSAITSLSIFNNYKLDQNHTLYTVTFDILQQIKNVDNKKETNKIPEYKSIGDIKEYSRNPKLNNLLSTFSQDLNFNLYRNVDEMVELEPTAQLPLSEMSKSSIQFWSPQGTYLIATARNFFKIFVTLGSDNLEFRQLKEFRVDGELNFVSVSPCERYILAYSRENSLIKIYLYNILTGITITTYTDFWSSNFFERVWSSCGSYFAYIKKDFVVVIESKTGLILDNQPIEAKNVYSIKWSPCNIRNNDETSLAIYQLPEEFDLASLNVVQIPSKKVACSKTFVNVYQCEVQWQQGSTALDYLSVVSQHFVKIKKITNEKEQEGEPDEKGYKLTGVDYTLDLIRLSGKKMVTLTHKFTDLGKSDSYSVSAWEPLNGNHICVMFSSKIEVFSVDKQTNKLKLVKKLDLSEDFNIANFTDCYWHPFGQYFILVDQKTAQGALAFVDGHTGAVLDTTTYNNVIRSAQWDPSGRYFLACNLSDLASASSMITLQDSHVSLYCISGRLAADHRGVYLGSCMWRPTGKLCLTENEMKKIKDSIEEFRDEYAEEDQLKEQYDSSEQTATLLKSMNSFFDWFGNISRSVNWPLGNLPSSDNEEFEDKKVVLSSQLKD